MTSTTGGSDPDSVPAFDGDELSGALEELILTHYGSRGRSAQKRIGPSEIGDSCDRKLTLKLAGHTPPAAKPDDKWAALLGTALHSWLAELFEHRNQVLGYRRYLIEHRVTIREGLGGTLDLFDTELGRLYDWKLVGDSSMRKYARHGMPRRYRVQGQLYGLGAEMEGLDVREVVVVCLPRGAYLRGKSHVLMVPYSRAEAERALARLDKLAAKSGRPLVEIPTGDEDEIDDPESEPTPPDCQWCPWFRPGVELSLQGGCPGVVKPRKTSSFAALIA